MQILINYSIYVHRASYQMDSMIYMFFWYTPTLDEFYPYANKPSCLLEPPMKNQGTTWIEKRGKAKRVKR